MPVRDQKTDHLLTPNNTALLIIDIQPTQVGSVASMARRTLVENIVAVAKTAKLFRLPTVISTVNVKTGFNQPAIHQLTEILGDVPQYDRTTLNAWEDIEFLAAVKATGRKKLIMIALWTEVCLAFPVLDALHDGYQVYPVVDAVGGTTRESHLAAIARMTQAGAQPISWVSRVSLLCELQRDWARSETMKTFADVLFTVEGH